MCIKASRWSLYTINSLCQSQEEPYHHLFYECGTVVPFWTSFKAWSSTQTDTNINISSTEIILGTPSDTPPIFDLYLTIAKMHIYCCKFQNTVPGIEGFAKE